jgi:magnesium transporter
VEIRCVLQGALKLLELADLPAALAAPEGVVWVDFPVQDPMRDEVLRDVFGFDERAVRDCAQRNSTSRLHIYPDHTFVVLHVPDPGEAGHVHSIEMDMFVGSNYVVTVHGPLNPAVDPEVALVETAAVSRRMDDGRWLPESSDHLVHAIVTGMNRRMDQHLSALRHVTWDLERRVTSGTLGDPEEFLEEMFAVRLALQAIHTMAALNREIYARLARLKAFGPHTRGLVLDSVDQFKRVMSSADIQRAYLQGVIDFYQTRINTKMTVAAERLAVIAAVTLPVTAVSSIMGMNVIVNSATHWAALIVLLVLMGGMSLWLLIWARRQGWW